uniref:Uncharacterized protein n=1 Tax=Glossina austeni TaxID=7395 RepID=A0A1A9VLE6_GLOAU
MDCSKEIFQKLHYNASHSSELISQPKTLTPPIESLGKNEKSLDMSQQSIMHVELAVAICQKSLKKIRGTESFFIAIAPVPKCQQNLVTYLSAHILPILLFNAFHVYKALLYFVYTPQSPHTQNTIKCFKKLFKQTQPFEPFDYKILINALDRLEIQAILIYLTYAEYMILEI